MTPIDTVHSAAVVGGASPTGGLAAELLDGRRTISTELIEAMQGLGLRRAFGIIGGAVVPFYDALVHSTVEVVQCRHETGAVFAAIEAGLAQDAPALVFVTTGPGLTNALTGVQTARFEGAKLLLISAITPSARRGRYNIQESSSETFGSASFYEPGGLFDYAVAMDDAAELPQVLRTLARGFARPNGFVAHVAISLPVQAAPTPAIGKIHTRFEIIPSQATMTTVVGWLREPFAIWIGHGARRHGDAIAQLAAQTGAPVLSTARAKGVFPETHPRFLGVSGLGGHDDLGARLAATGVTRMLVLGTRLGELSSSYDPALIPPGGMVHVDLDPRVPGAAYPDVETLAVHAEIGAFLRALLTRVGELGRPSIPVEIDHQTGPMLALRDCGPVRPRALIQQLQRQIVDGSDAVILTETGNSLAWTNHYLRFPTPGRYRMSGMFCPMGHVSAGALGTTLAGRRAVAVVGDGAMLMQSEVSTAAATGAPVIWVVLNDAGFGMPDQGLRMLGYAPTDLRFPQVDFVAFARSLGADGIRVEREIELPAALERALRSTGPFIVDVIIDPKELAPVADRIASIYTQTSGD
jgi:acetolactate synthase-1/2/3 large subunit